MNKDIAIKVENLSKVYKLYNAPIDRMKEALHPFKKSYHKEFYALNDVSFEIKKGDCVGIVGRNGAGKSTLLKIITGVLSPTDGKVTVNGRISALLELGAGFNPEYTGMENIYFQGNLMGYSNDEMEKKVEEIINFADIGDFIHQPVKNYSSGMFARLAFSVAINVEPEILIVDEALSTGDFMFQYKCLQKIKSFREQGVTVLFVSHSSQSIIEYCNHAIFLYDGAVKFQSNDVQKVIFTYEEMIRNHTSSINSSATIDNDLCKLEYDFDTTPNLELKEHRIGTHDAILREVFFTQSNSPQSDRILLNSGVKTEIKVIILSKKNFSNVVMGMSLRTVNGLVIWGDNTLNAISKTMTLDSGLNEFTFEFNLAVRPGNYIFFIGLADISQEPRVELDQRWPAKMVSVVSSKSQAEGFVHSPLVNISMVDK